MKFNFSFKNLMWWAIAIAAVYFSSKLYHLVPTDIKLITDKIMEWLILLGLIYWFISSVFFGKKIIHKEGEKDE